MEYIQEITLDLNTRSAPVIVYAKQADSNTRILKVHLLKDGNEYQLENTMAILRVQKPDGTYIGNYANINIEENVIFITLTQQTLAASGRALVDILLYNNNNEYLSTASFVLDIQIGPVSVMDQAVSVNEYSAFSSLIAVVGPAVTSVEAGVTSAQAAASSAWAAVNSINDNGIIITAGNVLEPGYSTPNIIVKNSKNNFSFHAPTVKPYVTATVSMIQDAEPAVAVSTVSVTPSGGENSNLVQGFKFDFTLPKNSLDVAVTSIFSSDHYQDAADASYVGAALSGIIEAIPSEIYNDEDYLIPVEHGGTNSSTPADARSALGAQRIIQTTDIELFTAVASQSTTKDAWYYNSTSSKYTYIKPIEIPSEFELIAAPHFDASPNDLDSWVTAGDITLGPPSAGGPYGSNPSYWDLTFPALESPSVKIGVTVNWW